MLCSFDINSRIEKAYNVRNTFDSMLVAGGGFRSIWVRVGIHSQKLNLFPLKGVSHCRSSGEPLFC